ncbi:hypothetical protein [Roseiconus lacunae]|uniref:Uncharacterized protein n=1 Tax=Roseiconus lacunae TaxID=2605694 RepID=A0ABT7PGD4_9BACT|nr:hypothetical protein [Roseiconus lacunae]MCD0460510.1 hypothetical protein [Roseiconus lacunae]MDM4015443.1 hypothetical protein [Roseiconus lacunae]WRQ52878.1 hypothetical protein U8335_10065 [Stieleria sp. HD01]
MKTGVGLALLEEALLDKHCNEGAQHWKGYRLTNRYPSGIRLGTPVSGSISSNRCPLDTIPHFLAMIAW